MDTHSLHEAIRSGHDVCEALIAGSDFNIVDDVMGRTPLHQAIHYEHVAYVRALLAAGADPNIADARYTGGGTPLHKASYSSSTCVRALIDAGADLNAVDEHGNTPLHNASYSSSTCVRALIDAGADLNAVDNDGKTPLQLAVQNGRKECANILAVRVLAYRALAGDEWDLVPPDSDIGYLLPVVMSRDGRDAAGKLVSRLPESKRRVLKTVAMCMNRFVSRDMAEQIFVRCV